MRNRALSNALPFHPHTHGQLKLPASSIASDDCTNNKIDDDGFNHPVIANLDGRCSLLEFAVEKLSALKAEVDGATHHRFLTNGCV
jgi:hypothetical protein